MENNYSKIFRREDGSQVKIDISISFNPFYKDLSAELEYRHTISTRSKGKKKWKHFPTLANGVLNKDVLKLITAKEIFSAKHEFWKTLEPSDDFISIKKMNDK